MKVRLRDLKPDDSDVSFNWRNDPEVWVTTGRKWNNVVTAEMERDWIQRSLLDSSVKRMAICVSDEDIYVGNVQVTDLRNGSGIFHIFIGDKKYWGAGIGTRATELMIEYCRKQLCLTELRLFVLRTNVNALKIYKRHGFTEVNEQDGKIEMKLNIL
jgi:RimJ/RimL family protein N-acetyltransferase